MPFQKTVIKQVISIAEADQLALLEKPITQSYDETTWKYMPLIARYTGARFAEVAQLTHKDIIHKHDLLCISINSDGNKSLKTASSQRLVPISNKLLPHINKLISLTKKGRLFKNCGDWTDKNDYTQVAHSFGKSYNKAVKKLGSHITFHKWREYAINQMADAGIAEIDRMRVVGHSVRGTHAIYTVDSLERAKKAVDSIY